MTEEEVKSERGETEAGLSVDEDATEGGGGGMDSG